VRWTSPGTWHLTLLFLGAVQPRRVGELAALVDDVSREREPYRVVADLGGGRLRHGEGVGWLGLSQGAGQLIEIASELATACPDGITVGGAPKRTPSAHLTLVRRADGAVIEALRAQAQGPLSVEWSIDRIHLVRSHLEADGARYETAHESAL
jgi:2'-5' RNA ligase